MIDSSESCSFVVEVKITSAGPVASTVLLDMSDVTEQQILFSSEYDRP